MKAYNRRAQLEIWKTIVNKRHDPTRPLSEYLDFIHTQFGEMEKQGFVWTKYATLGILLQAGLPDSFPDSFDHVNDLLDELVQSSRRGPRPIDYEEVKDVVESEDRRMKSSTLSLCSLPVKILIQIIEEVQGVRSMSDTDSVNPKSIREQRRQQEGEDRVCKSLRPLAAVNCQLHELCMPYVWKVCMYLHLQMSTFSSVTYLMPHSSPYPSFFSWAGVSDCDLTGWMANWRGPVNYRVCLKAWTTCQADLGSAIPRMLCLASGRTR